MKMLEEAGLMQEVVSMLNNPTVEKLKDMKLKVMAQMFVDPALRDLSFEERLAIMVEKEWLQRKNNRIKRLLYKASLAINACIEDIDYTQERKIDKKTIRTLSSCIFIEQRLNIIISGKTGCGKSFLACAFGNNACRYDYTVRYYRIPELLLEIQSAKNDNYYIQFMEKLKKVRLLILDDLALSHTPWRKAGISWRLQKVGITEHPPYFPDRFPIRIGMTCSLILPWQMP